MNTKSGWEPFGKELLDKAEALLKDIDILAEKVFDIIGEKEYLAMMRPWNEKLNAVPHGTLYRGEFMSEFKAFLEETLQRLDKGQES